MEINLRNLDLTKELLETVNNELMYHPKYYARLIHKLQEVLKKYEEDKND